MICLVRPASQKRGVTPYAELLGTHLGNSAFHPTRLDVEHVSHSLNDFISRMEEKWGINRHQIAKYTSFMSHEPATPPRGGSAAAEMAIGPMLATEFMRAV